MKEFKLRVFRYDPEKDAQQHYETYTVPYREGMTVLEALLWVFENLDGSLAFRYSCREAICGSCAMYVSGSYRLACRVQVKDALEGDTVTVSPLPHMRVIKDLVVDQTKLWENYARVKPWLINDEPPPERERRQSPADRAKYNKEIDCILCGSCFSSCPSGANNDEYLGPHALNWANRFFVDTRDTADRERLEIVASEYGVFRCHTIFNCVEACPKHLNPTEAIQNLKKAAMAYKLGLRK
ncbi:succinate dehydrogenase / fumarate reductase iron-sulfur subunit [Symbiobacterium terraclitae]|uniref:Succinate dehydrogenase iron-sulfur subunit n=1 Tax=Symbiobacterium terraclitae TaxID=557451 RepID=A0ABS4JU19_9FIRM|nr:succinate dehydrogenase iron-sulfur subunit [Symbiobacterium terraclitae]MBP2017959.1 succinate dehydrogenase / fumarate reductase iron-sulfur subunit [Symbiobacterium terraclitae]